jgi:hypothetical protein
MAAQQNTFILATMENAVVACACKINQIQFIYKALLTSADISKCCTETQPQTPNIKQCRCRSMVARKNSIERKYYVYQYNN